MSLFGFGQRNRVTGEIRPVNNDVPGDGKIIFFTDPEKKLISPETSSITPSPESKGAVSVQKEKSLSEEPTPLSSELTKQDGITQVLREAQGKTSPETVTTPVPSSEVPVSENEALAKNLIQDMKSTPDIAKRRESLGNIATLRKEDRGEALAPTEAELLLKVKEEGKIRAEKDKQKEELKNKIIRQSDSIRLKVAKFDQAFEKKTSQLEGPVTDKDAFIKGDRVLNDLRIAIAQGEDTLNSLQKRYIEEFHGTEQEMADFIEAAAEIPEDKEQATLPEELSEETVVEAGDIAKEMAAVWGVELGLGGEDVEGTVTVKDPRVVLEAQLEQSETLEARLNRLRTLYVEEDVKNMTLKKRLSQHFPWLSKEDAIEEHKDVVLLREQYHESLRNYYQEQIDIARAADNDVAQGQAFEALLRGLRVGEALRLEEAYQEHSRKEMGVAGKWLERYEDLGRWYNGLSKVKKVAIAGGVIGGSLALSAVGGSAIIATGALALRRFMAGAGSGVLLDQTAEEFLRKRREKKQEGALEDELFEIHELDGEAKAKKLEEILQNDVLTLDKEIKKRRKMTAFRRFATLTVGASGGLAAFMHFGENLFGQSPVSTGTLTEVTSEASQTEAGSGVSTSSSSVSLSAEGQAVPASGTLEAGSSSQDAGVPAVSPDGQGMVATEASSGEPHSPTAGLAERTAQGVESTPVSSPVSLPESYVLSEVDGKKGIWGVLERNLPLSELSQENQNRVLSSTKNLIASKLEALSPEERLALGFRSTDINTIYAGDTLKLDSLVSQEELRAIIDGKIYDAPVPASVPVDTGLLEESEVDTGARETSPALPGESPRSEGGVPSEIGQPDNLLDQVKSGPLAGEVSREGMNVDVESTDSKILETREWLLQSSPETRQAYYEALTDVRKTLVQTNDLHYYWEFKNFATMGDIQMKDLTAGNLAEDQIERLNAFQRLAAESFGDEGKPLKNETIGQYTSRILSLSFQHPDREFNFNVLKRI